MCSATPVSSSLLGRLRKSEDGSRHRDPGSARRAQAPGHGRNRWNVGRRLAPRRGPFKGAGGARRVGCRAATMRLAVSIARRPGLPPGRAWGGLIVAVRCSDGPAGRCRRQAARRPAVGSRARPAERAAGHARHHARRPHRRLRPGARPAGAGDAAARRARGARHALRQRGVGHAPDAARALDADDRAAARRPRRARQRRLPARPGAPDPGRGLRRRRLPHRRLRLGLRARPQVGDRPGLRALLRRLRPGRAEDASMGEIQRRGDETVAQAIAWIEVREAARRRASASSGGSISTIRTRRTRRPSRARGATRASPTTARSPGPTAGRPPARPPRRRAACPSGRSSR